MSCIVNIILIVLVCISIPIGLCEDGDMLIDLKTFLNEDMTNIEAQNEGLISSQSSRLLAQRANESDVDIGVMKFYNPDEKVALAMAIALRSLFFCD